jgi:hypothetical protein
MSQRELINLLEQIDIKGLRLLWGGVAPNMPLPDTDEEMLTAIHLARTKSDLVRFRYRAYSHAWLSERGYPSLLPDELRPKAQRLYPVTTLGVGIAVKSKYDIVKTTLTQVMQDAVLEAEADGKLADSPHVKIRMMEARLRATKKLFG